MNSLMVTLITTTIFIMGFVVGIVAQPRLMRLLRKGL